MTRSDLRLVPDWSPDQIVKRVVVKGFKHVEHVEFAFIYGDPNLSVELVLPFPAFASFCADNHCELSAESPELLSSLARLQHQADPTTHRLAALASHGDA